MRCLTALLTLQLLVGCTGTDPLVRRVLTGTASSGEITVRSAYALVPFSNSPMPAYLSIENDGTMADTLIEVTASGGFGVPSLHGGGMDHLAALVAPAGARVQLAPGGQHLMFEPPLPAVARGDSVRLTLRFSRAGTVAIMAHVIGYDEVDQVRKPE